MENAALKEALSLAEQERMAVAHGNYSEIEKVSRCLNDKAQMKDSICGDKKFTLQQAWIQPKYLKGGGEGEFCGKFNARG